MRPAGAPAFVSMLAVLAVIGLAVGLFAILAWPAYAKDANHSPAPSNVSEQTTEHFYLWTSTMTVGKTGITTRGYAKDTYGELSQGPEFNHPPFSPPPKHNFNPDYKFTVIALNSFTVDAVKTLVFSVTGVVFGDTSIETGNVTLWIENNGFPLDEGSVIPGSFQFKSSAGYNLDGPDLVWAEGDKVRVALTYEHQLPSAPTNVRVTAPRGENRTLDVRWNPATEGTFPIECYMVEFRHTSGGTQRKVQHVAGSRGQGDGCGDNPSTRVLRTDLEPGVQYQVLVQALSGDGHGDWSEMKTVKTNGRRTLKAWFVSPPEQHDGSGQVKVQVAFSEAIKESPENVGKHGVQVEGGRLTSVRQVDNQPAGDSVGRSSRGQNDEPEDSEQVWEFELEPDSDDDLTLRIDAGRSCDKPGAICTADGRSLSKGIVRTVQGPEPVPSSHFYLWTATMTVGENSGYLGYEPPTYGSFSTGADFNYPPFSPPPKHNFDPDYENEVQNLYTFETDEGEKVLQFDSSLLAYNYSGNLTLWIRNTSFQLKPSFGGSIIFSSTNGSDLDVLPDLDWAEGDQVRVALTYEQQLPSAPTNVSVTAPSGENGTLQVNWDEADAGTHPIDYYLVEFRNPNGETPRTVQSYVPSTATSVLRTDLERGVAYQVFVQALSGDGHGAESERKTGVTTPGIPTSCEPNQGDLWCGVVRVGELPGAYGYNEFQRVGNLSDTDFNVGTNSYTITVLSVAKQGLPEGSGSGSLTFSIDPRPGAAEHAELLGMELHVNSDRFNLSDVVEGAPGYYYWAASVANLDWSGEDYIIARLREASSSASSPGRVAERLTAAFQGLPVSHDGETPFTFGIEFSETVSVTPETMRTSVLTLEGGTVTGAARVDGETGIWKITVTPDTQEALSISLPPVSDCDADGAVCTPDRRSLSTWAAAIVAGPADQPEENTAATGTPTISGTVQVGATLTADTSGIADDDGLENVSFNHQWVADDTAIQNATNSTYTLADADAGKAIKVQVSFTDDGGNDETLTSSATEAVAGNEESITSKDVADWSATMTVEWVYQGYGYYSTDTKKAGSLSPASFNVDGTTYTVKMVETQGWWTYIGLDQELPFDFVLELDGTPFASDDASFASYSYGNIYRWEGTGLSLRDGDTVEVRLLRAFEDETGGQQRRHRHSNHQWHCPSGRDTDSGHLGHCGRRWVGERYLQLPVAGRRHGTQRGHWFQLHPGRTPTRARLSRCRFPSPTTRVMMRH